MGTPGVSPHLLAIRYGRSGLRALLMFNLPAAFLGLAVAAVVNPTASGDDLAILVTVPLLILVLVMRAIMIWRPQPELAPEQREAAAQALKQLTLTSPAVPAALLRGVFKQFLDAVAAPLTAATSLLVSLLRHP